MNKKPASFTHQELVYLMDCVDRDPRGLPSIAGVKEKLREMLIEISPFLPMKHEHVWQEQATGKYLWEDEAGIFDEARYDTEAEAITALNQYIKYNL